jgi:hypothetical protein
MGHNLFIVDFSWIIKQITRRSLIYLLSRQNYSRFTKAICQFSDMSNVPHVEMLARPAKHGVWWAQE